MIKVRLITWNVGDSIKKIKNWNKDLQNWTIINDDIDILFITIQESSKNFGAETFKNALNNKINKGQKYKLYYEGLGTNLPSNLPSIKEGLRLEKGSRHASFLYPVMTFMYIIICL